MKDGLIVSKRFLSQAWSPRPEITRTVLATEPSKELIYENMTGMKQRISGQCLEAITRSVIQIFGE